MAIRGYDPDKDIPSLAGKVILVTGGTGGLGGETILELAKHNPSHIYFTGRDTARAAAIASSVACPSTFLPCDHASLGSIRAAADAFLAASARLDIFIANVGIMAVAPGVTANGYEVQFGTNHVGNAALALHLLPVMEKTTDARFVAVSSLGYAGHPRQGIDFTGLRDAQQFPIHGTGTWVRYGQSKLANILFARELGKRYPGITSVVVHPGVVETDLVSSLPFWNRLVVHATNPMGFMSPRQGAYNTLWAATAKDVRERMEGAAGAKTRVAFFQPVGMPDAGDAKCWDDELGAKLWEWTVNEVAS